ncbi:MAG: pyridoxal phosphate-dependent aminotransferase [Actinomycetota bacterium]|nr:pyridoxal phosphate-dependent aminotransferase [Actinomycetota bacterium]MDQ2957561.1 pyridoxal phosphate-dependent aminotransferase [Actinomycetota bacterium]
MSEPPLVVPTEFIPSAAVERIRRASARPTGGLLPSSVVSLAMGEPDFDTPPEVVQAAIEALNSGWTRYGDLNGDPELRALIADQVSAVAASPFAADQVLVTHGGSAGLAASILAVVSPGDRVVLPDPTYSMYADQVELAGGTVVPVPILPDGHLDFEALAPALRGARLFAFCNPGNPTGAVFDAAELRRLGELIEGTETLVLADEAYADFVYDGKPFCSALSIPALAENLIYCQTLSKTYAMTGWRIGYLVAPRPVVAAIGCVHRSLNASINAATQRAALTALRLGPELSRPMLAEYQRRRDFSYQRLRQIPGLSLAAPEGAFYAFARYNVELPSIEVVRRLIEHGVAVRAGREFGRNGERHLRISFAASLAALDEGLSRLEKGLASLG